jgi:hypothetical protein
MAGLLAVIVTGNIQAQTADTLSGLKKVKKELHLDPVRATMMSAALPGFGQIYNRKYWKIPLVYAGFGAVGYAVVFNSKYYNMFTKAYQDFTDLIPETDSYVSMIKGIDREVYDPILNSDLYDASSASWIKDQLLGKVDYYRKYRDLSYIGIALWYLISIMDANVDASLSEFEVSNNLDIALSPIPVPLYNFTALGLNVTMKFNF